MVNYEELEKLQELKNSGGITEQEFEVEKYKILHNSNNSSNSHNTKGIYIASLVLGICALLFGLVPIFGLILSIVALIISIVARKKVKVENSKSGLVTAGIITSIIGLIIALIITIVIPLGVSTTLNNNGLFEKAKEVPQTTNTTNETIIPNLVGLTIEEAEKKIKGTKLTLTVIDREYNKNFEKGKIISQSPVYRSGYKIKNNTNIQVIVSLGNK